MHMRKGAILILTTGCICSIFALDARVTTMGRTDNFFMDEVSIFRNPANIGKYPNMLMGDLGIYKQDPTLDSVGKFNGLASYNRDPVKPFFGGILSYSLNQSTETGDQYPMISVGAVLNRYDKMLNYLDKSSKDFKGGAAEFKAPVGKFDILMGCALKGGGMIGIGAYVAYQKMSDDVNLRADQTKWRDYQTKLIRGNLGVNWPVTKTMDLEASAGVSLMSGIGWIKDSAQGIQETIADNDISFKGDLRLFSALTSINGDFVPHFGIDVLNFRGGSELNIDMEMGVGVNINIDRGFFWMGAEGIFRDIDSVQQGGGRISFGIERNIVWDWLVWRIGGTKSLLKQTGSNEDRDTRLVENVEADASDDDMIGFGMGLNIENRFRVDAVMAEDLFYTFTNLFSGNHHHLFTRFSATYSF
jgi:hypothetical protein